MIKPNSQDAWTDDRGNRPSHILVVDDEKSIRFGVKAFLEADGYRVNAADGADAARRQLRQQHYDVVLTDILMPGMSGVQLLEMIRTEAPDVPVIMMTGDPTVKTAVDAIRAGATDYLTKPISRAAILKAVRQAAELKRFRDENKALEAQNLDYRENLEQRVRERTLALNRVVEGTIQAMALAVESRDPYTAGHEQNVANLASAIARKMDFKDDRIKGIYCAGLVHDLGKISVPAEILSYPGRLSPEAMALVRKHPTTAYHILAKVEFPWPLADMVYQHHEWMDGSGYPCGLRGDEILQEARILAVSDVVEALSSHRPYRPALGVAKAMQEIERYRGLRYDEAVVDICLHLFREEGYLISTREPQMLASFAGLSC